MPEDRQVPALHLAHILPETAARRSYWVTVPVGTRPDDLCKPEYWKHVVADMKMRPNDCLKAISADGSWYAEYLVRSIGTMAANVKKLHAWSLVDESLSTETESHYVKFIGPNSATRYGVFRKSDDEEIKRGFQTPEEATEWMNEHLRPVAA